MHVWINTFFKPWPALKWLVLKVVILPCSSSGCEHNWSIEGWIHSKRRNRLGQWLVELGTKSGSLSDRSAPVGHWDDGWRTCVRRRRRVPPQSLWLRVRVWIRTRLWIIFCVICRDTEGIHFIYLYCYISSSHSCKQTFQIDSTSFIKKVVFDRCVYWHSNI